MTGHELRRSVLPKLSRSALRPNGQMVIRRLGAAQWVLKSCRYCCSPPISSFFGV